MNKLPAILFFLLSCSLGISCQFQALNNSERVKKINGVCLVAPRLAEELKELPALDRISPNYVAVVPFAFKQKGESRVNYYKINKYWYGEGVEGCTETIRKLKSLGYKVMLKPHVWVVGDGWPGDFQPEVELDPEQEELQWQIWEDSYRDYMIAMTQVAVSESVELFCIGTEYRIAVQKRPEFWKQLIREIRSVYKGKLTYAANWDNYQKVGFWSDLDFIGIDAYFPLSESKTPSVEELTIAWQPIKTNLMELADSCDKPLIFTEYGYRSIPYTTRGDWKNNEIKELNQEAQYIAYEALYRTWWKEPNFGGGFLWKWFPADSSYQLKGGEGRFSPQGKKVEKLILETYQIPQ